MAQLSITNLNKSFGTLEVLCDMNLEIPQGSLTAIVGPSGSGKTTLLRIIAGFDRPNSGSVVLDGTEIEGPHANLPPQLRRIGYVPQEGSLFPHLTVEKNIAFGLARKDDRGSRVTEMLTLVGLRGLEERYPHELSGGQQQRVALARALAVHPTTILLDEPFSALDPTLRAGLRSDVRQILRRAGVTAVLVTHDQDEALSLATHVAVVFNGSVRQFGTPQEIYDHPVDPETAQFLGEANLMSGIARGDTVLTPLGNLELRTGTSLHEEMPVSVTVLVRPEQIDVEPAANVAQLTGTITETEYHGHDTVLTISLNHDQSAPLVRARLYGRSLFDVDDVVHLKVRGGVLMWESPAVGIDGGYPVRLSATDPPESGQVLGEVRGYPVSPTRSQ